MAVYVDRARHRYGRMIMCHMLADTEDELHAMAERIGVAHRWYQAKASTPHYDICRTKRALAIHNGAVDVGRREVVSVIRRIRDKSLKSKRQPNPVLRNNMEENHGN